MFPLSIMASPSASAELMSFFDVPSSSHIAMPRQLPELLRASLNPSSAESIKAMQLLGKLEEDVRQSYAARLEKAANFASLSERRQGALLREDAQYGSRLVDSQNLAELGLLLAADVPRPRSEAYQARQEALFGLQCYLGQPRPLVEGLLSIFNDFRLTDYDGDAIAAYFQSNGRLNVEPPRHEDVRTWRFLLGQDLFQQRLVLLGALGDQFAPALQQFADELEALGSQDAELLRRMGKHAGLLEARRRQTMLWLADRYSSVQDDDKDIDEAGQSGFLYSLPASPGEMVVLCARNPLAASAIAGLASRLGSSSNEYNLVMNILRSFVLGDAYDCNWMPDDQRAVAVSEQPTAASDLLAAYRMHSDGILAALESYEAEKGAGWASDPAQRLAVMGNLAVQQELRQKNSARISEIMRDTLDEWLAGARLGNVTKIEISLAGLPYYVVVLDAEQQALVVGNLQKSIDVWLRDQLEMADARVSVLHWYAMHGISIIFLPADDELWFAGDAALVLKAAEELAVLADGVQIDEGYNDLYNTITSAEAVLRVCGLWSYAIQDYLPVLLSSAAFQTAEQLYVFRAIRQLGSQAGRFALQADVALQKEGQWQQMQSELVAVLPGIDIKEQ